MLQAIWNSNMNLFNSIIDSSFESFYSKEYMKTCNLLKQAYNMLLKKGSVNDVSTYHMEKALTILEELVQLPEFERTDHVVNILSLERAVLFNDSTYIFHNRMHSISRLLGLIHDLRTIINYWDEYLDGINSQERPSITVGIESKGKYVFYENIYQSNSLKAS